MCEEVGASAILAPRPRLRIEQQQLVARANVARPPHSISHAAAARSKGNGVQVESSGWVLPSRYRPHRSQARGTVGHPPAGVVSSLS
mmetsp:Transcript_569/g.1548  ORF Transcript_569/g.1548 Transcript_569/m.1548 type:complete len:87 (-) Transcript_569:646-906(-)